MSTNKKIHILGGGTFAYLRNHLAFAAPAYGSTAKQLVRICKSQDPKMEVVLTLTRMANRGLPDSPETIQDVSNFVDEIVADPLTKIVFFSIAMVDFTGNIAGVPGDKYAPRLNSRIKQTPSGAVGYGLSIHPTDKVIAKIRKERKDIFLVAFKQTCGDTPEEQYLKGLNLLKENQCNLVLANDVKTKNNMIIVPEEAVYHETKNREEALANLVDMALLRSHLTFTRSTVVDGYPINWDSELIPETLRSIVDYCIDKGAYKKFRGVTAGHFAVKLNEREFLTSRRKTDFNDMKNVGLVLIQTDGPDSVIAYGSKPSVGGQSQRIVFHDHQEYDCIVHFHCPILPGSPVPITSQRAIECGSHECGKNTSDNLKKFGNLSAVYLENHGPNIVFNKTIDPQEVIDFIEANFNLEGKTGGYSVK